MPRRAWKRARRKPRERPHRHGAHQRRIVVKSPLDQRYERSVAGISGGDEHIAQEAIASGALDRRAAEAGAEGGVVESKKRGERRIVASRSRAQFRLARGLRELVPGTDGETVVAAEDAVAHRRAEARRDVSLMLDGEIGDARARVDAVGRGEGMRGTYVEATPAGPAMILFRRVGSDLRRGEDRADEEPRSEFARYEIGVLALPAEPGAGGERLLHHRRRIDEDLHVAVGEVLHARRKRRELRLEHVVIIVALRVDRDRAARSCRQDVERVGGRSVVQSEQDDALRLRPQRARAFAALRRPCEPAHVAVPALGEERLERVARAFGRIGRGKAHGVEAERPGLRGDPFFQRFCHASLCRGGPLKNRGPRRFPKV